METRGSTCLRHTLGTILGVSNSLARRHPRRVAQTPEAASPTPTVGRQHAQHIAALQVPRRLQTASRRRQSLLQKRHVDQKKEVVRKEAGGEWLSRDRYLILR